MIRTISIEFSHLPYLTSDDIIVCVCSKEDDAMPDDTNFVLQENIRRKPNSFYLIVLRVCVCIHVFMEDSGVVIIKISNMNSIQMLIFGIKHHVFLV